MFRELKNSGFPAQAGGESNGVESLEMWRQDQT